MKFPLKQIWVLVFTLAWVGVSFAQQAPRVVRKTSDELTERVVKWQEPVFPPIARQMRAGGAVVVELTIDEQGKVVSAQIISGHPLLRASLLQAARVWEFKPVLVRGVPVRLAGRITYSFPSSTDNLDGKTVVELEQQTQDNPNSAKAHYDLGVMYLFQSRDDEAFSQFTEAVRIDPKMGDAHLKLGHQFMKRGDRGSLPGAFQKAQASYSTAARLKPKSSEALHALGVATMSLEDYEGAIEAFKGSLQVEEPILRTHFYIGKCYFRLGRPAEAVGHYERGLSLDPESDVGRYGLGEAYLWLGRYDEAIKELNRGIKISGGSDSAGAHLYLGLAYLRLGNTKAALKEHKLLVTLDAELASQLIDEIRKSSTGNTSP